MTAMTLIRSIFLAAAAVIIAACSSGPSLPDTDADLSGTISDFVPGPSYLGAPRPVLVERDDPGGADRSIVHVQSDARIYLVQGRGGRLQPVSSADLVIGDRLQVWTTGVELRSDPGQVFATRVHVYRTEP
jgi:hypothetical protein